MSRVILPLTPCQGCGKMILWAEDQNGRPVPLDPTAATYKVSGYTAQDDGSTIYKVRVALARASGELGERAFVSHFATCPKAADFSSPKRRPPAAGDAPARASNPITEGEPS